MTKIESLTATAARDELGLIHVVLTDGAASLLVHALADGHPESLDTLIGGLASGVRSDPLKKYLTEAVNYVEGMTEEDVDKLLVVFMRTMTGSRQHGERRGQLIPVTPKNEDELEFDIVPSEFYMMLYTLDPDDFEESPQRVFVENLKSIGESLVEPQEKFIVMNHTAEVAQA